MTCFLVTGASGFLGMQMTHKLLGLGHRVIACGRNPLLLKKLNHRNLTILQHDISTSFDRVYQKFVNYKTEFIIHCAALSSPWGSKKDFFRSNVQGTQNVLELAKKLDVKKIINISTPSIYFNFKHRLNIIESDFIPCKKVNNYSTSKWKAEQLLHSQLDIPVITLRPKAIMGPGEQSIMPRVLNCIQNECVPLIDGGTAQINITYLDDVIDSILLACNAKAEINGSRFNITNDTPVTVYSLFKTAFKAMNISFKPKFIPFRLAFFKAYVDEISHKFIFNSEPALTCYAVGVMAKSQTFDIKLAKEKLRFKPKTSPEEAMKQYAKWYLKK